MQRPFNLLLFTIIPAIISVLGYYNLDSYPLNIIVPLSLIALYFLVLAVVLTYKVKRARDESISTQTETSDLKSKLDSHDEFLHKRKLFINHDLAELRILITEYEGYVKNFYRGQKFQGLRDEVSTVKDKSLEIINKEKRDFDEQLYDIQGNKDNR